MQATKVVVKKVKIVTKKVQSTKVKKLAILQNNIKKTLIKTINKKKELNKMPDISITTQRNEGYIQPE